LEKRRKVPQRSYQCLYLLWGIQFRDIPEGHKIKDIQQVEIRDTRVKTRDIQPVEVQIKDTLPVEIKIKDTLPVEIKIRDTRPVVVQIKDTLLVEV